MESAAIQKVRDARSALLLTHPFFGVLSLKLALREEPNFPSAGVNAKELVFNPDFTGSLTGAELKGLIAHEVMHLALLHPMREGSKNHDLWNRACDFAINSNLLKDGFTLPQGGCVDARFDGMSAEQIYRKLESEMPPKGGRGKGDCDPDNSNAPAWGAFDPTGPEGSAENEEAAREWAQHASEAIRAASSAGKMPAGIKRLVDDAANARAPWEQLLKRFMHDQVRTKQTWSKPNKRFMPGIYLPGKYKDGMGCLVVGVDTSGSIDQRMLSRFAAEISSIAEDVEPQEIHVVYCDAVVNRVDTFQVGDQIKLAAVGGGGTRFTPVFERIDKEGWTPAAMVYLTDLECSEYPQEPGYPVLWANYGRKENTTPIGEVIHIE